MKISISDEIMEWLDFSSKPWKPKEDTPAEIRQKIEKWLEELKQRSILSGDPKYKNEHDV